MVLEDGDGSSETCCDAIPGKMQLQSSIMVCCVHAGDVVAIRVHSLPFYGLVKAGASPENWQMRPLRDVGPFSDDASHA